MRRLFIVILAFGTAMLIGSCDFLSGARTYRYRVTVEVDTPEGVRSGSSVWQIKSHEGGGPGNPLITQVSGDAVAVQLPTGTLFALKRSQDLDAPGEYAAGVIGDGLDHHPVPGLEMTRDGASNVRKLNAAKPAFDMDPSDYPLLVRFRDPGDPGSVERVSPDGLSAAFGSGVHLRRIGVAVTDDQAEHQLDSLLPWLHSHRGSLERCPHHMLISERPLKCLLIPSDF